MCVCGSTFVTMIFLCLEISRVRDRHINCVIIVWRKVKIEGSNRYGYESNQLSLETFRDVDIVALL